MASFDELLKKANQPTQPTSHFNDLLKKANEKRAATAEDQALFDSFKKNADNYFNSFKTDAEAVKWGTSASTYQKYSGIASDLYAEGNKLKTTLNYLDIDEEQKNNMLKYIDDVLTSAEKGTGILKQTNDYYSQFASQEELDSYKQWEYANSEEGKEQAKEWEEHLEYIRSAVRGLDVPDDGFNGIQEARRYLVDHGIGYPFEIQTESEMKKYLEGILAEEDAKKDAIAFARRMYKYETEVLTDYRIQRYKEAGGKDYAKSLDNDDQMSENERLIYNILKSEDKKKKGGGTSADVFADFIQEVLNQKEGAEIARKLEDKTVLQELYGIWAGISNWGQGIGTFFTGNTTPSATQYASGMIRQELETKNENWAALYDVSAAVGQMLPSIALAYVTGGSGKLLSGASKGAGTVGKVGSFLQTKGTSLAFRASFGAAAYGNAYSQMVNLGYNESQAKIFATLSASSEVLLDNLLGGISGFTGKLTGKSITKAAENIDNAFFRIATSGLIRNMGEFTEESLQTVLEPLFKRIATGEVDPVNWGEAIYSGVLGFTTSAILGLPVDAFNIGYTAVEQKKLNKAIDALVNTSKDYDFARTMPEYSASYRLANVIKNKGTAYNLISEMAHLNVSLSEKSQNTIKQSLIDLGYPEEVAEMLVGAINTVTSGGNITNAEKSAIEINPQLSALILEETVKNDVNKFGLAEEYKNFEQGPVSASEIIHEKISKKLPEGKAETNRSKVKYDKDSPVRKISDLVLSRKADSTVTDAEVKANKDVVSRIGKALGYEVIYDDGTVLGKVNGKIDFENKKITLNTNVKNPVEWILKHEIGHFGQDTKAYADFVRKVRKTQAYADWLRAKTGKNASTDIMEAILNRKTRSLYEEAGYKLGDTTNILTGEKKGEITEASEEIISDFIADELFSGDTTNLENFLNELDKPTRNKFIQWILDIIDTIKQALTKGDKKIQAELSSLERQFTYMLKESRTELQKAEGGGTRQSYSSIVHTFFGVDGMSTEEFMSKDYKKTEGYKELVETSLNNMRQSRENFDEKTARAEIEKSIDGIVKVAIASKKAGYDIADSDKQRGNKDSKKRLLFSSLEPNSDYLTSSDISTICDKRKNFAQIYDDIVRAEEKANVPKGKRFFDDINNYFYLHNMLAEKGLTQPCRQCYVESMRKNLAPMARKFLQLIQETNPGNKSNDQLWSKGNQKSNNANLRKRVLEVIADNPEYRGVGDYTIEDLSTEDGLARLRLQEPLLYEAFNSFYGQSKPKMPKSATPFRFGELTALLTNEHGKINKTLVDKIESTGGFRLHSYSDFQIQNFVDVLQVLFEAGTLGLTGHAYTKVPAFLTATKGTNLKRNISIFMYKDGTEWKIDANDSFPGTLEDIYDIVRADESGDTGIIAVSQNAEMSAWIMANDMVGYGIPFHKSGHKMGTVRNTDVRTDDGRIVKGYAEAKDHTRQQSEVYKGTYKKVTKPINIYEFWDFENKDNLSRNDLIKKNLKEYIRRCDEAGYIPKFREYLKDNAEVLKNVLKYSIELGYVSPDATIEDISFKYKGYTVPYGYYKFLGDFGMFKPNGEASSHKPLSLAEYDFDQAVDFFSDAETLKRNEVLQQFANGQERQRYRESDLTTEQLQAIISQKRQEVAQSVVNRNTRASITEEDGNDTKFSTFKEVSSYRAEGRTLSDSALEAYQNGEMPKNVWTRKDFIFAVHEVNPNLDITEVKVSGLKELFLEKTGIHETGKGSVPTQFYKLNEEYVKSLTQKDINGIIEAQGEGTDFERGLQYVNAEGESDYTEQINEVYRQFNEGKITEEQRDSMLDSLIADARTKYGTFEQGESVTGDEKYNHPVPERVSKETKNRRFVRTVTETGTLTKEMLRNEESAVLSGLRSFVPTSNKENLAKAMTRITNGQAEDRWRAVVSGNTSVKADDVALGELMLAGAIKSGDAVQALKLTAELSEVGTRLGQAVQALSLLKRMGGLGELYYVQRAVDTLNKNFEKQFGRTDFKQIKVNEELSLQLLESKTETELERAMEAIMKDVASQVPATFIEKWNAWRYMSMLANPKTILRNLAGNLVFAPAVMMKNALATVGEMVVKPEERTKTFVVDKKYKDFAKENWGKVKKIIMHGGKYSPSDAIQEYRRVFKNPALEGVRKAYGWALEGGDEIFIGGYYRQALSQYLAANKADINNVDESVLAKAEEYAAKEALKNTYRDASYLANALNSIARNSWFGQLVVEGVIPFKKTPINILKRSVEYSPVGLIHTMGKGLINLKTHKYSGSQIIDSLAGGLTGTGIMLVGMFCAKALIANFGFDDEDEWWKKMNGEQEFAIKLGDSSYTVDWMAPAVVPFFIGVSLMEGLMSEGNENVDFAQIAASSVIEPLVQLSMLQGVQESLSSLGGYNGDSASRWGNVLTTVISSYLTQGVPTLLGKVASTMDDTSRRNYIEKDSKVPQWVQMVIKKTQAKIPWLSDNRTPYVNAWGEDEKTGPLWERIVEGFVSPGYFSKATEDDITREITRLYESVGDKKVLPTTPKQKISFKGYNKALTEQEFYQLSVETGRKNAELVAELLQHEDYDKLSDSSKVAVISAIYNWSLACAKANLLYTFEEIEKMEVVDITEAQYNALKDSSKQAIAKEYFLNETLWKQERKNGSVVDYLIQNEIKNSGKKPKEKPSADSVINKFS